MFMYDNIISEQTFGNIIWNEIFVYARIYQNYWTKYKVPWHYTHSLYFINCLWHDHILYKAKMQLWSKPHKKKDFWCAQASKLTENWAFIFWQLFLWRLAVCICFTVTYIQLGLKNKHSRPLLCFSKRIQIISIMGLMVLFPFLLSSSSKLQILWFS